MLDLMRPNTRNKYFNHPISFIYPSISDGVDPGTFIFDGVIDTVCLYISLNDYVAEREKEEVFFHC